MQRLLDYGVPIDAEGGPLDGNALYQASEEGHQTVVNLLIARGADVNGQGGLYRNALQAASIFGAEEVVRLLL